MGFTVANWIQIVIYLVSFAFACGIISQKMQSFGNDIKRVEAKQDKHNGLIERMVKVETRLDGVEREQHEG